MISAWWFFAAFLGSILAGAVVFALLILLHSTLLVLWGRDAASRRQFPYRSGVTFRRLMWYPVSWHPAQKKRLRQARLHISERESVGHGD
jgi:hypothetical protein